jgi:hypothetical protein
MMPRNEWGLLMRFGVFGASFTAACALACASAIPTAASATVTLNITSAGIDPTPGGLKGKIHYRDATNHSQVANDAIGRIELKGTNTTTGQAVDMQVYCIDITSGLSAGQFEEQTLAQYSSDPDWAIKIANVTKFLVNVDPLVDAGGAIYSAAAQLGVWEILNEASNANWNVLSGNFWVQKFDTNDILTAAGIANGWLTQLHDNLYSAGTNTLTVLNPGHGNQPQAFVSSTQSSDHDDDAIAVPEPTTWGMVLLGFGLLGALLRRRKTEESLFA